MNLHDRILLWRWNDGALTRREIGVLRRTMRSYRYAYQHNLELPVFPRRYRAHFGMVWIWVVFRVSIEQPVYFVLGVFSVLPISLFLLYSLGTFIFNKTQG